VESYKRLIQRVALACLTFGALIVLLGVVGALFDGLRVASGRTLFLLLCIVPLVGTFCVAGYYHYLCEGIGIKIELLRESSREDERPPILFLRAFAETDLTETYARVYPCYCSRYATVRGGEPFSYFFGKATAHLGRLLAIGKISEARGHIMWHRLFFSYMDEVEHLYLVTDDERWYRLFDYLARSCRAILVIPEITPGVEREISLLANSALISKTVVFMPPTTANFEGLCVKEVREKYANRWSTVQEHWRRRGLRLPDYDRRGILYRPNADFSMQAWQVLGGEPDDPFDYSRIGEAAVSLLREVGDSSARPLSVILNHLEGERLVLR